jgi:hypothetical protein
MRFSLVKLVVSVLVSCAVVAGCSGADGPSALSDSGGDLTAPPTVRGAAKSSWCHGNETRACGVELKVEGDNVLCAAGKQTCSGGVWAECVVTQGAAADGPAATEQGYEEPSVSPRDGTVFIASLSETSSCETPCDPACYEYVEQPPGGVVLQPSVSGYYHQGTLEDLMAHAPAGFIDKGLKKPCVTVADCQFDFHCVAGSCVGFKPREVYAGCAKPDITTSFSCANNGVPTVPVCNRGTVVAPAGIPIYVLPGNSTQFPTCSPDKNPGKCFTKEPIPPGTCVDVTGCPGLQGNGNNTIMANPPGDPKSIDECTCSNNWTDWHGNSPCVLVPVYNTAPLEYSQIYQGVCPLGTRVQWQFFTYTSTTPLDSNVVFAVRTAATEADLINGTSHYVATAKATPLPNTQTCTMTGPTPCPMYLPKVLTNTVELTNEWLELQVTLNPSTDRSKAPTISQWDVTYTCPATE